MVYCSLCNIAQCFEEEAPMLMPEDITAFSPALSTVEDLESRTKSQKTDNIDRRMKEAVVYPETMTLDDGVLELVNDLSRYKRISKMFEIAILRSID